MLALFFGKLRCAIDFIALRNSQRYAFCARAQKIAQKTQKTHALKVSGQSLMCAMANNHI